MSDEWNKCVRPHWRYTVDNFALSQDLEAQLIEEGLVSPRDLEDVRACPTDYAKKRHLVWTYLSTKGPGSLRKFCSALKGSGSAHLSRYLLQAIEQTSDEEEEATEGVEDPCDVVEVWIYILPTYEDKFRANENRITSALKKFLCRQGETLELIPVVSVNPENVDDKNPNPHRKVFSMGIGKTTAVDLIFPEGREDVFKREGERLLKHLKLLLHLQSDHRILGSYYGFSCIVKLILPGEAALQLFLTALFTDDLAFLENVMGPVKLKFGNLPPFHNGDREEKIFSRNTVREAFAGFGIDGGKREPTQESGIGSTTASFAQGSEEKKITEPPSIEQLDLSLLCIEREPSREELINLSKRLLRDWKEVARRLSVPEEVIVSIEENVKDANERSYQMLLSWMERRGRSATVWCLCRALLEEGKTQEAITVFSQRLDKPRLETWL